MFDPVNIVFGGVGGLLTLAGLAVAGRSVHHLRSWRSAFGTVIAVKESPGPAGNKPGYTPVVEFTTQDGKTVCFTSSLTTSWHSYREGARCRVIYNPRNDADAQIVSTARLFLPALTLLFFGIVFVLVGIL